MHAQPGARRFMRPQKFLTYAPVRARYGRIGDVDCEICRELHDISQRGTREGEHVPNAFEAFSSLRNEIARTYDIPVLVKGSFAGQIDKITNLHALGHW